MRLKLYAIFNKETNERIFTTAIYGKCEKILETIENSENYEVRHKWTSV